ncbi:hypothetical protein DPSP01_000700 [Paraphaeosphaeria sporulosa]
MSTAIALTDMHASTPTLHHRNSSKPSTTPNSETEHHDPWLDTLQATSPSPSHPFSPTHTYWITPHGLLTRNITILDLTHDISTPYTGLTPEYKTAVQAALKDHSFTPTWTCQRINWLGLRHKIIDTQGRLVAEWTHPWTSVGAATLAFTSQAAPEGMHALTLKPRRWGLRTEAFVLNSVQYIWEMDSTWHSTHMTLYRVFGEGETARRETVAKYAEKWWGGIVTGGALVVDGRDDGMAMVACLSAVVVLKKKRQRAAERRSGGE